MANTRFLKEKSSFFSPCFFTSGKISLLILALFLLAINTGCATSSKSVTLRILDAESQKPIRGAVCIAMWTRTRGLPGLTSRYTAKAIEAVSDASGLLTMPPVSGRYAKYPRHLKIYKAGYVGWDSRLIYLGPHRNNKILPIYDKREGFSYEDQTVYLEHWKDEYTFVSHGSFIQTLATDLKKAGLQKSKYEEDLDFERTLRIKERRNNKRGQN